MIYFLRSSCANGFIKIGLARDLWQRIDALQPGSPYQLKLVRVLPGGRAEERALHERFRSAHYRGEWYRPTEELLRFLITSRRDCLGSAPEQEPSDPEHDLRRARMQEYRAKNRLKKLVGTTGIEPVTPAMSRRCSPAELRARSNEPENPAETAVLGAKVVESTSMSRKRSA